jgi:leucyl-tRNA synthetase
MLAEQPWPTWNPSLIERPSVTMVVQVNGKLRDRIEVESDIPASDAERLALTAEKVQPWIDGHEIRKVIVREPNLVNIVVG